MPLNYKNNNFIIKNNAVNRKKKKKDNSGEETREKIIKKIFEFPGLHLSELSRILDIPKSTLYYHLNYLIKQSTVISNSQYKYKRYYIDNEVGIVDKKLLLIVTCSPS